MNTNLPTLEELLVCQQKLMQDIAEAENLVLEPEDIHALNTAKAGLKLIEEKIAEYRARNGDR